MASANVKYAILRAKINGVLTEILTKTDITNVFYDENTTLAAKLAEVIADVATKASSQELTDGLAGKADKTHSHAQSEVTGLSDALNARPTTDAMNSAISAAIDALIDGAPETYNTLKEVATYISEHQDVVDTLNAAIGQKADKTTVEAIQQTINALGALAQKDTVSEDDLDAALKEKVNAAAEGNHSHANKALLDTYDQTNSDIKDAVGKKHSHANQSELDKIAEGDKAKWDTAAGKAHEHTNKDVIDGITAENVTAWNGKSNIYYSATEPATMNDGDLWVQLVE